MSKDIECPYCGIELYVDHDDGYGYDESAKNAQECNSCGKNFIYTTFISFYYEAEKADCLNGAEHEYRSSRTYPREFTTMDCKHCDHTRKPTPEEWEQINKD